MRHRQQFDSVKLPCCLACNAELARRFENSGAEPGRRLLSMERPALTPDETLRAALWVLKTWLLLAHPRSEFQSATPRPRPWSSAPVEMFSWQINGQSPPAGLSMWAFLHDQERSTSQQDRSTPWIALPTVVADGVTTKFQVLDLTIALVNVTLIFHPGWPIAHVPASVGEVSQLWPLAAGTGLARLPVLSHRPLRWRVGPELHFRPGAFPDENMRPLAPNVAPESLVLASLDGVSAPPVGEV
ncbi:MAG: hypothetical protein M3460_20750 [Actinomycetota bacterium]|nr:hypothetical protein [Actinomycetota bacterium]